MITLRHYKLTKHDDMIVMPYKRLSLFRRYIAVWRGIVVYAPTHRSAIAALLGRIEAIRLLES